MCLRFKKDLRGGFLSSVKGVIFFGTPVVTSHLTSRNSFAYSFLIVYWSLSVDRVFRSLEHTRIVAVFLSQWALF